MSNWLKMELPAKPCCIISTAKVKDWIKPQICNECGQKWMVEDDQMKKVKD